VKISQSKPHHRNSAAARQRGAPGGQSSAPSCGQGGSAASDVGTVVVVAGLPWYLRIDA